MSVSNIRPAYEPLWAYTKKIQELSGSSAYALYVIQHDRVAAQLYHGFHSHDPGARPTAADSQFHVASVRKSYLGFAVSWALHHGRIQSLDDPIERYLSWEGEPRDAWKGVTLRHVLTHTHGLADSGSRLIREFEPGTGWAYNPVGIRMLTRLIPAVTGLTVPELLNRHVFEPLGWTETEWRSSPHARLVSVVEPGRPPWLVSSGASESAADLYVSARDLARWGALHLHRGRVQGRPIVPEAVIDTAVSLQSPRELPKGLPPSGCLWWVKHGPSPTSLLGERVPDGSYEIVGFHGPLVLVVPKYELVVVRMANRRGNYGDERKSSIDYLKEFSDLAVECAASAD